MLKLGGAADTLGGMIGSFSSATVLRVVLSILKDRLLDLDQGAIDALRATNPRLASNLQWLLDTLDAATPAA